MRSWGGNHLPFGDQESVSRNAKGAMMMEPRPCAPLVVPEPDFLLEFLVIALNAPAHFCEIDKGAEGHALINSGEPIFCGRRLSHGPFDQQRFFASCA